MFAVLRSFLIFIFISKTFVKAGTVVPPLSSNPHNYEVLKLDKAVYEPGKEKVQSLYKGKRKTRPKAISSKALVLVGDSYLIQIPYNELKSSSELLIDYRSGIYYFLLRGPPVD